MSNLKWIIKQRDFEVEDVKFMSKFTPITKDQDPLMTDNIILPQKKSKYIKKGNVKMKIMDFNPLDNMSSKVTGNKGISLKSNNAAINLNDPLDQSANKSNIKPIADKNILLPAAKNPKADAEVKMINFSMILNKNLTNSNENLENNWSFFRKNLMDLFCSNFNMEVKSSYSISMDDEDLQKNYKIETGRNRLEDLEADKKDSTFKIISSGEYVAKMEMLKREMMQKWEVEDKVGTLKIIIHCTKILNDIFTPKFYTHKFLIISDILDIFLKMVYERIYKLSFNNDKSIEFEAINPDIVPPKAKDICSNWMYKCSCIRELLPRIYIDIIFLKMFKFIFTEKEVENKILIIAKMIRGLYSPLISFFVSMYLCKIAMTFFPKFKSYQLILLDNLSRYDLNDLVQWKLSNDVINEVELKKILYPCVEWILHAYSKNITNNQFVNLMKIFDQNKNFLLLKSIILHIPSKFIFNADYLEYIFACTDLFDYDDQINLFLIICNKIITSNTPIESKYINIMWEKVKNSRSKVIFIDCCILIVDILMKFFPEEIQDKFFEEVFEIFKVTINTKSQDLQYYHRFENFLYSILTKINNYSNILNADNFLYLIENFNADIKLNICNAILNQIINSSEKINDPYLSFSLLKIGKNIHDSIDANTPQETKSTISSLLINFIKKVDFGIDYENLLNFYTEARGAYSDLEDVIEVLIKEVQRVCIHTYKLVKGKHNKKTLRFCKVCIAYCQITIPSIGISSKNLIKQLNIILTTAQISLMNNLISEADSLLKNFITVLAKIVLDFKDYSENEKINKIKNLISSLVSFLIVVPSNPESPFQLVTGLINVFNNNAINDNLENDGETNYADLNKKNFLGSDYVNISVYKLKLPLYISLIKYLICQLQTKLPYHVQNIDSNDEIFTKDETFKAEANELLDSLINFILEDVSLLDSKINKNNADEALFLSGICLQSVELFTKHFDESKNSNSVSRKMIGLGKKYLESFKNKKLDNPNSDTMRELLNLCNQYEI